MLLIVTEAPPVLVNDISSGADATFTSVDGNTIVAGTAVK
jgi:hypothetical protein